MTMPPLPDMPRPALAESYSLFQVIAFAQKYGEICAAASRGECIAICDLEASKSLEMGDLEAYYGTSAYAISNAIKARGTT